MNLEANTISRSFALLVATLSAIASTGCALVPFYENLEKEGFAQLERARSEEAAGNRDASWTYARAEVAFRFALIDEPDSPRLRLGAAEAQIGMGGYEAAARNLDEVAALYAANEDPASDEDLAGLVYLSGLSQWKQSEEPQLANPKRIRHRTDALSDFGECFRLDRWNERCALAYHRALVAQGSSEEAYRVLSASSILLGPQVIRALAFLNAGDYSRARWVLSDLRRAVGESPTLRSLYCLSGVGPFDDEVRSNRISSAKRCVERLPAEWDDDKIALFTRARILDHYDPERTTNDYEGIIRAEPRSDTLMSRLSESPYYGDLLGVAFKELSLHLTAYAASQAHRASDFDQDQTRPTILIAPEISGVAKHTPVRIVTGEVRDNLAIAEVRINGTPARLERLEREPEEGAEDAGPFRTLHFAGRVVLVPGDNRIVVTASDMSGNQGSSATELRYQVNRFHDRWVFAAHVTRFADSNIPSRAGLDRHLVGFRSWLTLGVPNPQVMLALEEEATRIGVNDGLSAFVDQSNDGGAKELIVSLDTWFGEWVDKRGERQVFFLPYDARLDSLEQDSVKLAQVLDVLSRSRAEKLLLILNIDRAERRLAGYAEAAKRSILIIAAARAQRDTPIDPAVDWPWHFVSAANEVSRELISGGLGELGTAPTLAGLLQAVRARVREYSRGRQQIFELGDTSVAQGLELSTQTARGDRLSLLSELLMRGDIKISQYQRTAQRITEEPVATLNDRQRQNVRSYLVEGRGGDELFKEIFE